MKQILRGIVITVMLLSTLMLSGCERLPELVFNPQELYSLPKLPDKYTEINHQLSAILDSGAEYAAPTSGTNIQPVQVVDLDGDNREETVAFFRDSTDEKPLKVYVFAANGDTYEQTALIEGSGTGIYSIAYDDLDGDGRMEISIGWKATADLQVLEIYALRPDGAEVLLSTSYVKYTTIDLDGDRRQELVVLRADEVGDGVAEHYNWQEGGGLTSQSSARISMTMAEVSQQGRITKGMLHNGVPAVFVTGVTDTPKVITDILTVKNGTLSNIVLSERTGVSSEIAPYCSLYPADINGDGVTEVPWPVELFSLTKEWLSYQMVNWHSYDSDGTAAVAMRTYHNIEDQWYFCLPESWLNHIWVERMAAPDESAVTFYILGDDGRETEPFLQITAITGSNRERKAVQGERFLLARQPETIYTAELLEANNTWQYGISADEVRAAFNPILPEWTAGDY